jgi:hypothetical protein
MQIVYDVQDAATPGGAEPWRTHATAVVMGAMGPAAHPHPTRAERSSVGDGEGVDHERDLPMRMGRAQRY